ncbi:MAG: glycosyl hydrolase, partial [Ktedonobacteraceae bacterium]
DTSGQEIKSFSSEEAPADPQKAAEGKKNGKKDEKKEPRVPKEAGTNRFAWNMRYPDPIRLTEGFMGGDNGLVGPMVAPGTYQVRLTAGEQNMTVSFEIQKDPRVTASQRDLEDQCTLLLRVRDRLSETHEAITLIRDTRQQVEQWEQRTQKHEQHEAIAESAKGVKEQLAAIEEELIQVKARTRQDTLNHPAKLNAKITALTGVVASADAAPTEQAYALYDYLVAQLQQQQQRLQTCLETELAAFNRLMRELELPAVLQPLVKKGFSTTG